MSNEALWSESFGDEYTVRNDRDYVPRETFFLDLFRRFPVTTVMEIGCNNGMNIDIISKTLSSPRKAWGCDVNQKALNLLHVRHKEMNAVWCSGYETPFKDGAFDCVFTCGVLIHQRPQEVETMMQEAIRISSRYVLAMEYHSDIFREIPYRGNTESLFKGPFGEVYEKRYGLKLLESGFLDHSKGFDDITWWMLEK